MEKNGSQRSEFTSFRLFINDSSFVTVRLTSISIAEQKSLFVLCLL